MLSSDFFHSEIFNWLVLPVLIFLSRMTDVTLGTLRHIFLSKGFKRIVPLLGFFEVLIWLVVIGQIMKNLNNFACYIAWAGGFSMGTFIGMKVDEKLALGLQMMRIIVNKNHQELMTQLAAEDFGVTLIEGQGSQGPVKIILTVVNRKNVPLAMEVLERAAPQAFYSLEDIRETKQGVFRAKAGRNFLSEIFLKKN